MDILIIDPFNPVFLIVLALFSALCAFMIVRFRARDESTRKRVLIIFYLFVLAVFIIYKIIMGLVPEYSAMRIAAGEPPYNFFDELPFNLCNFNLLLLPVGLKTDFKPALSFCFYLSSIGAAFALIMPDPAFCDRSVLNPLIAGYYLTHFCILLEMPLMLGLKIYKPDFRDIVPLLVNLVFAGIFVTGLNYFFRLTGLSPTCNYFYSIDQTSNPVLALFRQWIPVPLLCLLPCLPIAALYASAVTAVYKLFHCGGKKSEQ